MPRYNGDNRDMNASRLAAPTLLLSAFHVAGALETCLLSLY